MLEIADPQFPPHSRQHHPSRPSLETVGHRVFSHSTGAASWHNQIQL